MAGPFLVITLCPHIWQARPDIKLISPESSIKFPIESSQWPTSFSSKGGVDDNDEANEKC